MNDTSKPTRSPFSFGPEEPECSNGTMRHAWQQQRQHDLDIFGDTDTKVIGTADPSMSRRDYSFREYHCDRCGARKQVSTEVRTAYAKFEVEHA